MPSTAETVPLGPFTGGLNTKSDPSALAENELVVCENFELDFDGSLRTRPPIVDNNTPMPLAAVGSMSLLGYYHRSDKSTYLIASDGASTTYFYNGTGWGVITSALSATAVTQFNGFLWLIAGPTTTQNGGYWDGTTYTAVAAMPRGNSIVPYKSLLYIGSGPGDANPSRLYRSNSLDDTASGFWPATKNFVDIGYGDGESIQQLVVQSNSILVFRSNSIRTYSWTTNPQGYGDYPLIQTTGLDNPHALDQLDGVIFFIHEARAYQLINGRVQQMNERVPLAATSRAGFDPFNAITVSVFNRRVLFGYYDTTYVYSTETATWTTWKTPTWGGIGRVLERTGVNDAVPVAYTSTDVLVPGGTGRFARLLTLTDTISAATEHFVCTMQTKTLDYGATSQYKRLFYWGIDALFRGNLTAQAVPVTFNSRVTWGQVRASTWGQLRNNTWGQPLSGTRAVVSNRASVGSGPLKKYVKLNKSLRFRQIYYRVSIDTDGSVDTAPVKIFDIVTFVRNGERAVKTIS